MRKRTTPVIIKIISHVASCEDESVKKNRLLQYNGCQSQPNNTAVSHRSSSLAGRFLEEMTTVLL